MIPPFQEDGCLPPGIHETTWQEINKKLAFSPQRKRLLEGLWNGIQDLKIVGCQEIYIDGSFVRCLLEPKDIDVCYLEMNIDFKRMKEDFPELLDIKEPRTAQKDKYFCEFLPSKGKVIDDNDKPYYWIEYFQKMKYLEHKKGIISLKIDVL